MAATCIKAGLVGLPNVGKSTLFNALTNSSVPAENYPFCTIAPHVAYTAVPDSRITQLQAIYNSQKTIPATVQFVDIAGLVKGAASGEGLGNQFLTHIREVDLIIHVVRCFQDPDIVHVSSDGVLDPHGDLDIIMTELMLKDSESVTKRQAKVEALIKAARHKPQELAVLIKEQETLKTIASLMNAGNIQSLAQFRNAPEIPHDLILSSKDFLVIANCSEQESQAQNEQLASLRKRFGQDRVIPIAVRLEQELALLPEAERADMRTLMGYPSSGLEELIKKTYQKLGLISFFTCGPQEIHAWPITSGTTIRLAAGEIHSDLERGFICAEIFAYNDLIEAGNENKLRLSGKLRTEGQEYTVHDGDIVHIKFNV